MTFRRAAVLLCVVVLAGCTAWTGPRFYSPDQSLGWLQPGAYRADSDGKSKYVRWDGKHFTRLRSARRIKEDIPQPTVVSLSGTKLEAYIAQFSDDTDKEKGAVYALAVHRGDGWLYAFPDCATTKAIVLDAGGTMDGPPFGRKFETTENVSIADVEADPIPPARHKPKHPRHARPVRPTKIAQVIPADSANVAQAEAEREAENQYGAQTCHFDTQASLEKAARRYLAERQLIGHQVVRIGD